MKSALHIAPAVLFVFAACGGDSAESHAGESAQPAGASTPAAAEEALPTPEEAAAEAEQAIDASNADAELKRLQEELGGG